MFLGLFTFQLVLGVAVAMTPVNLIKLLIGTQVLQGIVTRARRSSFTTPR